LGLRKQFAQRANSCCRPCGFPNAHGGGIGRQAHGVGEPCLFLVEQNPVCVNIFFHSTLQALRAGLMPAILSVWQVLMTVSMEVFIA